VARILVVDDEPDTLRLYSDVLRDAGHEVLGAADGEEALELLDRRPDLVLLDLMMPRLNGYEFMKRLGGMTADTRIPIVATSGLATGQWATRMGATRFLKKPFDLEELVDVVLQLLTDRARRQRQVDPGTSGR
jgi:CheY-like chemotaxis protein